MHGSNFACLPRSSLLIMASMPTRAKIQIQNRGSKSNIGPDDGGFESHMEQCAQPTD